MPKKVEWLASRGSLHEAVTTGLEFAFLSSSGKQACRWCHCRDFLHDVVRASITGKACNIFSFVYDPKKNPKIATNRVRLLVANSQDRNLTTRIPACLDFVHQIEDKLEIKNTVVTECDSPPAKYRAGGVWYFRGHKRWIVAPPMLSLYTLLIRVGMGHVMGEDFRLTINQISLGKSAYCRDDSDNLEGANSGIKRILRSGDLRIFPQDIKYNYPSKVDIDTFHDTFGIVGFSEFSCCLKRWN